MIRHIPNLISLLRVILVPFALRAIWLHEYERALLLIFVAGASDFFDGFLARRLRASSRAGAYIDPVADKLLLSGTYLVLGLDRAIPIWITGVVLGRDLLILLFTGYALGFTAVRSFPPTIWGKLSTAVQIVAALAVLFDLGGLLYGGAHWLRAPMLWAAVVATVWSALDYLRVGVKMLKP